MPFNYLLCNLVCSSSIITSNFIKNNTMSKLSEPVADKCCDLKKDQKQEQGSTQSNEQKSMLNAQKTDKKRSSFIGNYQQAPGYMKDNEHITHGYRIGFNTPKQIFQSLFMVHNESVNIWSHFLPALILLVLIGYFLIFVGPTQMMHGVEGIMGEMNLARKRMSQGIEKYGGVLGNLSIVGKMKEFKIQGEKEMEEFKRSIVLGYSEFQQGLQSFKTNAGNKFETLQTQFKSSINNQLHQLQSLKQDFQKIFVPLVINGIIQQINPQTLQSLSTRLQKIKQDLDSQQYNYIQLPSHNTPNRQHISRWPIFVFLFSAVFCLTCSTLFHLFYPMSGNPQPHINYSPGWTMLESMCSLSAAASRPFIMVCIVIFWLLCFISGLLPCLGLACLCCPCSSICIGLRI